MLACLLPGHFALHLCSLLTLLLRYDQNFCQDQYNVAEFCFLAWQKSKNLERFTNLRVILAQGPC